MQSILQQIIVCQSKYDSKSIYIRAESEDVYISSTIILGSSTQSKCQLQLPLSEKHPLNIEIWNYEPHKLLKSWNFAIKDVLAFKNKHMISDHNWIICLKKSGPEPQNKENKIMRSNKSRSCGKEALQLKTKVNEIKLKNNKKKREEINMVLESKSKSNKESIKKTLKNTIHYLIKQQSLLNNFEQYGMDQAPSKAKTGKCTPATEQLSCLKNYSTLFSQYGLNLTQFVN